MNAMKRTLMMMILICVACSQVACAQSDTDGQQGWVVDDESKSDDDDGNHDDDDDDDGDVDDGDDVDDDDVESPDPSPLADCDAEVEWETHETNTWVQPGFYGFTSNDGLIVKGNFPWGPRALPTRGGDLIGAPNLENVLGVDAAWTRAVQIKNDRLIETSFPDGRILESRAPAEKSRWIGATISPDGSRVVALSCDVLNSVTKMSVLEGDESRTVELPGSAGCLPLPDQRRPLELTADSAAVIVGMQFSGQVLRVDLDSLEITSVVAHPGGCVGDSCINSAGTGQTLIDLAVDPHGQFVVSTGNDGRLVVFDVRSLEVVHEIQGVNALINVEPFTPEMLVSPVAFSPTGDLLAHATEEGVVVRNRAWEEVFRVARTTRPVVRPPSSTVEALVDLSFSNDGSRLAARHYHGTQLIGCGRPLDEHLDTIEVTVDAPTSVRAFETTAINAFHDNESATLVGRVVLIDGEPNFNWGADGRFEWRPIEAGLHELEFRVDDGIATGRRSIEIDVLPAIQ